MTIDLGEALMLSAYGLMADNILLAMSRKPNQILSGKDLDRFERLRRMLYDALGAIDKVNKMQVDGHFVEQLWVYELIKASLGENQMDQIEIHIDYIKKIVSRIILERKFSSDEEELKTFLKSISAYTIVRHDKMYAWTG